MDWDKIAKKLEKLHAPSARRTADEIRRVRLLLHDKKISVAEQMDATGYLKKKMDEARRMYPNTDWDEAFGLKASVTDITPESNMERMKREAREELTDASNYNNSDIGKYEKAVTKQGMPDIAKQKALADRMRELGMSVVKKGGPKAAALLGGPIGWGIAGASALMDAKDAYALTESTMNPETEEDMMRQKHLADLMRRNEFY